MKGRTRHGSRIVLLGAALLLAGACRERDRGVGSADPPGAHDTGASGTTPATTPVASTPAGLRWEGRPLTHAPARFRPAAWADERTVVGLAGSRIARVRVDSPLVEPGPPGSAWTVAAAPGVLSWTNEQGWWVQRAGQEPHLRIRMQEGPPGTDGPPEVLWSPDGSRALLTWTGEGVSAWALVPVASQPMDTLDVRLDGYMPPRPLLWLDGARVLLDARALTRHDGTGGATEAGQRGDLALHDRATRVTRIVAAARDDHFLFAAGRIAADSLLVLERDRQGILVGSWVYDTTSWQRRSRPVPDGRTQTHPSGRMAIVTREAGTAALVVVDPSGIHRIADVRPAESEPVVWSPDGLRLAVLDDSRQPARLVIIRAAAN